MSLYSRYLLAGLIFLLGLIVAGVVGFMTLEHQTFLDALLTTVSAISTVGYSPPRPMSEAGKVLAILLIVCGLFAIALVISVLTEYFTAGHLHGLWERHRMENAISRLKDHFIISGFGRVGREVARTLHEAGDTFVILDRNAEALDAARSMGYLYYQGDASHDEVLEEVGVHRAKGLVACADSDVNNVYVTLTARSLNPDLFIVARAAQPDAEPKLFKAGANRVISPYVMAGRYMAQMAADPPLGSYLNLLFDGKQIGVRIFEVRAEDVPDVAGREVRELHHTVLHGAYVLAIDRNGERIDHVGASEIIRPNDHLLLVGSGEELERLATIE